MENFENPFRQYYDYLQNSSNVENQNNQNSPNQLSNIQTTQIRPTPLTYPIRPIPLNSYQPVYFDPNINPPRTIDPHVYYHPSYYQQPFTSTHYPQLSSSVEPNFNYESTRRENIGTSNINQEPRRESVGSGAELENHKNDDVQEEVNIHTTKNNIAEKFKWSQYKDEDLCMSWLNFTNDSIKGTDREGGAERLYKDYFSCEPIYPDQVFRRRFRMRKELFLRIVNSLENHSTYFQQRVDAAKRMGLSPLQKCTAAICILAYGTPADAIDEYIKIGESTAVECVFKFCAAIIEVFGKLYMRKPNASDVQRLLKMHEEYHGFPGMLGSLDCMHWAWKNCPTAWKGQYTRGDHGHPTIMLEAVASADLWIWHAYFGVAGSNNDLNVLSRSNLFQDNLQGIAPDVHFTVNGTEYEMGYYLVDGIYPDWATFVKSFPHPRDPKRILFKKKQESARKDVERAFGVLQARFAIVRGPARSWHKKKLHDIMDACIILHNMIVEDERHSYNGNFYRDDFAPCNVGDIEQGHDIEFETYLARDSTIRDRQMHHQLKADLMEHIWTRFGCQN